MRLFARLGLEHMDKNDCRTCGETKPVTEFHRNKRQPNGYHFECKECKRVRDAEYRSRPEVAARRQVQSLEYGRAFGHLYRGKYEIDWTKYQGTVNQWHSSHPRARRAYKKLHVAIQSGQMPKADTCACVRCGQRAKEYHHHNGYGDGHELDVIALCKSCHRREHSPYPWPEQAHSLQGLSA